jgi:Flp pilus assembly protein TadG
MARTGRIVGDDRGTVTVEAALALCSLMLVLALAIGAIAAVGAQLRCLDAAREIARLVARGEPDRARSVGESIAPSGARIQIGVVGDAVTVEVSSEIAGRLPGLAVSATAVGVLEPGALAGGR